MRGVICIYIVIATSVMGETFDFIKLVEPLTRESSPIQNYLVKSDEYYLKFVATWCSICRKELTQESIDSSNKKFIYIFGNYGRDSKIEVRNFLYENPQIKPAYFDNENILKKHFKVNKVPFVVQIK